MFRAAFFLFALMFCSTASASTLAAVEKYFSALERGKADIFYWQATLATDHSVAVAPFRMFSIAGPKSGDFFGAPLEQGARGIQKRPMQTATPSLFSFKNEPPHLAPVSAIALLQTSAADDTYKVPAPASLLYMFSLLLLPFFKRKSHGMPRQKSYRRFDERRDRKVDLLSTA